MKHAIEILAKSINWQFLPKLAEQVIQDAIAIQQIPAPTFSEQARAQYVAAQFARLGLQQIEIDSLANVTACWTAKTPSPNRGILVSAHTDTVFSKDTDLTIRRENNHIYGPGLGDNSIGVAGILGLISALQSLNVQPARDLWFTANTCEEGLGDLAGMKAVFKQLRQQIGLILNLEGMAFGHVYHAGIAVRRLHIRATGEGGHSWLNFGRTSAIHGIMQLGAKITSLAPPENPRTTYNIGLIEGGQSINTIATDASLWLDMRSEQAEALNTLENSVRKIVRQVEQPGLQFSIKVVGDRPSGALSTEHPLVQTALSVLEHLGIKGTLESGSTDANIPLANGCPAVTVGITRGGNAHREDEYIETQPVSQGMQQLILLTLAALSSDRMG
jgi:acetylornithine deacetylase/succinyl-diaminopimelate desuccinylase-like protein